MAENMSMGALFTERRQKAAAAASRTANQPPPAPSEQQQQQHQQQPKANLPKRPSFLDIQAEQEREAQKRSAPPPAPPARGGGGGRYGAGGGGYGGSRGAGYGGSRGAGYDRGGGYDRHDRAGFDHGYDRGEGKYDRGGFDRDSRVGGYGSRDNRRSPSGPDLSDAPVEQGKIVTLLDKFGFIKCASRQAELFFHYSELKGVHSDEVNVEDEVEFLVGPARGGRRGGERGDDGEEKFAAYSVRVLEMGTVVWEKEEEEGKRFRGRVERPVRAEGGGRDRNRGGSRDVGGGDHVYEGTIRLEVKGKDREDAEGGGQKQGQRTLVRFTASDFDPSVGSALSDDSAVPPQFSRGESNLSAASRTSQSSRGGHSNKLARNDLVEFSLVTVLRTGRKYARNITMVQSERDRLRLEKEKEMLAKATLEQGVVVSLKNDFGFLRSTMRRDEVYFHVSHLAWPEANEGDEEFLLKEGQEMEFLVLKDESGGGRGGRGKFSARDIKPLPQGSVEFHEVLAEGVTGIVTVPPCPLVEPPLGGGGSRKSTGGSFGKVHLHVPIVRGEKEFEEVEFHPADSPGGLFAINRDGSQVGIWVREGDVLLFDVVREAVDGSVRIAPTTHLIPAARAEAEKKDEDEEKSGPELKDDAPPDLAAEAGDDADALKTIKKTPKKKKPDVVVEPSVRLIAPSLAGRAEGVVSAVKDNYGFIHCAERPVDAYFRLYEAMPWDLQDDLRRNLEGHGDVEDRDSKRQKKGDSETPKLTVGMEVSFDLSLQGMVASNANIQGRSRMRGNNSSHGPSMQPAERENLKAQRIAILPPGTILQNKVLAANIRGVIQREDPKQPFAGYVQLDDSVKGMDMDERHPIVAKLLDSLLAGEEDVGGGKRGEIVFHDLQSKNEDDVVVSMAESRNTLECTHIPSAGGGEGHPGRLRIIHTTFRSDGKKDGDDIADSDINPQTPKHSESTLTDTGGSSSELGDNATTPATSEIGEQTPSSTTTPSKKKKKKSHKPKVVKIVRYDKHCLTKDNQEGMPPGKDDVVTCDVVQSRRTGMITLTNMRVVERMMLPRGMAVPGSDDAKAEGSSSDAGESGVGIVAEVVPTRQFGFISVLDENATRREMLLFHMSNVAGLEKSQHPENGIRKGDEVKFNIGIGKNGKRIAVSVNIVPPGTLPGISAKAHPNAARGIVLMEPSHTSLANTPSHSTHGGTPTKLPSAGQGRWANVGSEDRQHSSPSPGLGGSNVKEEGRILLLSDPANYFCPKQRSNGVGTRAESCLSGVSEEEEVASGDKVPKAKAEAVDKDGEVTGGVAIHEAKTDKNKNVPPAKIPTHILYKNGAVALQSGAGVGGGFGSRQSSEMPHRGDLVSFLRSKGTAAHARDVRIVSRAAATKVRGHLEDIYLPSGKPGDVGKATFVSETEEAESYEIGLDEVVSCDSSMLKDKVAVEGILHEGKIFGVCRTTDLYLESKIGAKGGGAKERTKLNLTVKKELKGLGGKIMAQSGMAKGPDGTNGFAKGWTKRVSSFAVYESVRGSVVDDERNARTREVVGDSSEEQPDNSEVGGADNNISPS